MKILATSDLHGELPVVPECDLFLIGGDVLPLRWDHDDNHSLMWLNSEFRQWLKLIPAKEIVGIAGNHDFALQRSAIGFNELHLPWIYLRDNAVLSHGLKIYGTPWVPNLPYWAFYADKEYLADRYERVPKDTDIVLSHGPPRGYGDRLADHWAETGYDLNCGSEAALSMLARVKPKAFVCGHIHEASGYYQHNGVDIWNVAYVDENYKPRGEIIEVILDDAPEEQTAEQREVHSEDPDARPTSEPVA